MSGQFALASSGEALRSLPMAVGSFPTCTNVDFSVMTFSFFIVLLVWLPSAVVRLSKLGAQEAKRGLILGHLQR